MSSDHHVVHVAAAYVFVCVCVRHAYVCAYVHVHVYVYARVKVCAHLYVLCAVRYILACSASPTDNDLCDRCD